MKKRALSLLLALALCLGLLGTAVPHASAAVTMPDQQAVYQTMIAMKAWYPEGMRWTDEDAYVWRGEAGMTGYGCAAFTFLLSDAAFGALPARIVEEFDYSDVKVGDILRINHDTHSVIVLEVNANGVVIAEGNYNSKIHWGRTMTKNQVLAADFMWTRYPLSTEDTYEIDGDGVLTKYTGPGGVVILPNNITEIGMDAFNECSGLETITIPGSVRSIGYRAFERCINLSAAAILNGVQEIKDTAFFDCERLYSVSMDSVTSIGRYAFGNCTSLTYLTLPSNLAEIGPYAFSRCTSLTELTLPAGVSSIGRQAFEYCENLTKIVILNMTTSFENDVFSGCGKLVIYGLPGSTAEAYAKAAGIPFVPLQAPAPAKIAYTNTQTVVLDGRDVTFETYALKDSKGNLTNYIKLRDMAYYLNGTKAQFSVDWQYGKGITLTTGQPYTPNGSELSTPFSGDRPYRDGTDKTIVNQVPCDMGSIILTDDKGGDYTYYKLRDMGRYLGFNVSYINGRVVINTNEPYSDDQ